MIEMLFSSSSRSERSPVLPPDAMFRYAAGVQYEWSQDFSIGVAYALIDGGSAKVSRNGGPLKGGIKGEYDTYYIHAINLNFVYRF